MIKISLADFTEFDCPNINCNSTSFSTLKNEDEQMILKCNICGEIFAVSFEPGPEPLTLLNYNSQNNCSLSVVPHPKMVETERLSQEGEVKQP